MTGKKIEEDCELVEGGGSNLRGLQSLNARKEGRKKKKFLCHQISLFREKRREKKNWKNWEKEGVKKKLSLRAQGRTFD